jgi:hypothetical protein
MKNKLKRGICKVMWKPTGPGETLNIIYALNQKILKESISSKVPFSSEL